MEKKSRQPAKYVQIGGITNKHFRVKVMGTIVDVCESESSAVIDDGTGIATIRLADLEQFRDIIQGGRVQIIGKTIKENEIEVEIVQDMSKLDLGLFEQVRYIDDKLLREV
jgi:hypothetical protein|tara:strand:+ start:11709 stop:12041 length:333 start_codon:yes stop_codon:yes gene_type:complete